MEKMNRAKFIGIFLVVVGVASAAISLAPGGGWSKMGSRPGAESLASVDPPPLGKNEAEMKILSVLDDISQGPWMANVDTRHGRLLRILAESTNAKNVVEIGTSNGYSALWICLGLRATGGRLTTFEIDPRTASLARANFERAGVDHLVTIVAGDAHQTVSRLREPIDILFLDADKDGYLDYLNQLLPLVRPGGLILADNVSKPAPSPAFLKAITTNPNLETVFLNMQATGLSVTLKKR
jgi:caffeoyl-CoA O-methyltransferase